MTWTRKRPAAMVRAVAVVGPRARRSMRILTALHLIRLFDFYLAAMFLIGTVVRIRQYRIIVALVVRFRGRWPKLSQLVTQHHSVFLTWGTVLPLILTLVLLLIHSVASRWLWPEADLTLGQVCTLWPAAIVVGICGLAMVAFDVYSLFQVSEIDRAGLEKYFDQAEYWLRSWTAPVVRVLSLGYINPRRIVGVEVRKALEQASQALNVTLWWTSIQTGLRILYGLALWLTYALSPWLVRWLHRDESAALVRVVLGWLDSVR